MSRILIIEDEESIADLEKDYLELSGFEVQTETRGDSGLQTKHKPLAFVQVVEWRLRVGIYIIGIITYAVREHRTQSQRPAALALSDVVSRHQW